MKRQLVWRASIRHTGCLSFLMATPDRTLISVNIYNGNSMKNNRKAVEGRQASILSCVRSRGEISVEELSAICGVSAMTVRRDLQYLERNGLLKRVYGKAVTVDEASGLVPDLADVKRLRDKISAYAAALVDDGDSIFINGSRTALSLLHYTGTKNVTVYTNNGWALDEIWPSAVTLHLTGGEIYQKIMVGQYVVQNLLSVQVQKTFLGCAAVYEDGEFRYDIPTEIAINEMMISRTEGELYILADHTKLKRRAEHINTYGSCRYNYPLTFITDDLADPDVVESLRDSGIQVILVDSKAETD